MPLRLKPSPTPPKRSAKRRTKRHTLRLLYRRGRIYVPVLALLLLVMAFMLPISPPGLAGTIGRMIEKRTGVPVKIESVRLRLSAGEITLNGIELRDTNGRAPFTIDAVHLTGDFGEMIAGSNRWPAQVVVDNPSALSVSHVDGKFEPTGPLATLIDAIRNAEIETDEDDEESDPAYARSTPAITIRNIHASIQSTDPLFSGSRIAIQRFHIPQRVGAADPVRAIFNGIATAGLSEGFNGNVIVSPQNQNAALSLRLNGIKRDVTIRGFGNVHMSARDISLSISGQQIGEGLWQIATDGDFGRFEISEMRAGGERWVEEDLAVRTRGIWNSITPSISEATLSIGGAEIDLAMSGGIALDDDLAGDSLLRVRRFPAPLIALGQRLARDEGFNVSRDEDSKLLVDVALSGPFASPGDMEVDGRVEIAGWGFQKSGWPHEVRVHDARGDINNSTLELSDLRLSAGTLEATGRINIPVTIPEEESRPGKFELSLRGTPETAFDFLRAHGITPAVVRAATVPLAISLQSDFVMERREGLLQPMLEPGSFRASGDIAWGEGTILLDSVPGTINIEPGGVVFNDSSATLSSFAATRDDIGITLSGRVDLASPAVFEAPAYRANLSITGPIAEILRLARTHVEVPGELQTVDGNITLAGRVNGVFTPDEWPNYDLNIQVAEGKVDVTFQDNPVRFSEAVVDLQATNERIELRRLDTRMHNDTHALVTASMTREGAQATIAAETSLETVVYMLPRELDDMVMKGRARADGNARVEVNRPLPEAPDVASAWMAAFTNPTDYKFHVIEDSPLRLRINADLTTLEPATVFHREFPQSVDNIRGIVRADELGFILESIPARWGDAEDVIVSGRVILGHMGPLSVDFEAMAPELDLNDWIDGWGEREWALPDELPASESGVLAPAAVPPTPRLRSTIRGRVQIGKSEFLTVRTENLSGTLEYEAWRDADNRLRVVIDDSLTYGGSLKANATILFPRGELAHIRADMQTRDVQINGFLADLRNAREQTVGLFTGRATLDGRLGDYSTWIGEGEYTIRESKFIGDQVLVVLSRAMRLGFEQTQASTVWRGTGFFRDEVVTLPDMRIVSSEFNLVADGTVGFNGAIDFRIAVEFLGNRIEWIPLIGRFAPLVNRFTDFLFSAKLEGTVHNPRVRIVPLYLDLLGPQLPASGGSQ